MHCYMTKIRWRLFDLAKICIYGTDKSDYVQIAKKVAAALHFHYGSNGNVTDGPVDWLNNPKAFSVFCMRSEVDTKSCRTFDRVRAEILEEHKADLFDLVNYDLVVDASYIANEDVARYIVECYRNNRTGVLLCGIQCLPTEMASDMAWDTYRKIVQDTVVPYMPVVTYQQSRWWILDGHARMYGCLHHPTLCRYKVTGDVTKHATERVQSFEHLLQIDLGYVQTKEVEHE